MKLNIGIIGYGNLGKSVEQIILSKNEYNLVAIFSRRTVKSRYNTLIDNYENITKYKSHIDVMLLCGGSKNDLPQQTAEALKFFDCINAFDTHAKICSELTRLGRIAKKTNHRLIMCTGWDPGVFSVVRGLFYAISNRKPTTFWGKGISMGHSDAIRQVAGVKDAVQFTIPNPNAIRLVRKNMIDTELPLHFRDCYVVCDKPKQKQIERTIRQMPNYFKGQPTSVTYVSHNTINNLKKRMRHKGQIITSFKTIQGTKTAAEFKLSMESNSNLTAAIMCAYIKAISNLKLHKISGAYTCLDIPISFLFSKEERQKVINELC